MGPNPSAKGCLWETGLSQYCIVTWRAGVVQPSTRLSSENTCIGGGAVSYLPTLGRLIGGCSDADRPEGQTLSDMVAYTCNPSPWDAEAGGLL